MADTEGVVRVIRAVFDEYSFTWEEGGYHADLYNLQGHYFDKGHLFWVAVRDDEIVGTVALEFFAEPIPDDCTTSTTYKGAVRASGADCSLERLYVLPTARNGGIGGRLVQKVIDEAKSSGRKKIELWSDKRFGDAHRLYGRFGGKVIGERICHDPDQSPEWGLVIETLSDE